MNWFNIFFYLKNFDNFTTFNHFVLGEDLIYLLINYSYE